MKNRTMTVTLPADRDELFAFLARLENLPEWAPNFCAALRREGHQWRAVTPLGDLHLALMADARTGTIDLFHGVQPDEMNLVPLRVLRQPHGAAVTCTLFQPVDWADELFEMLHDSLAPALRGLMRRYGGGELHGETTGGEPFYPNLVTARFFETWDFYTTHLGFRTSCESDRYVHLAHPGGAQIGVLRHELDVPAPELVSATDGRGFWLSLDVADADREFARLRGAGVDIAEEIGDKPWGDRQFVVRDPNGVLIAIAHRCGETARETRPLAAN